MWHPDKHGDAGLTDALHELGALQRLEICRSGSEQQRDEKGDHEWVSMVQGENGQEIVLGARQACGHHRFGVRHEVPMGEQDAFGSLRRSGCVEQRRDVIRTSRDVGRHAALSLADEVLESKRVGLIAAVDVDNG